MSQWTEPTLPSVVRKLGCLHHYMFHCILKQLDLERTPLLERHSWIYQSSFSPESVHLGLKFLEQCQEFSCKFRGYFKVNVQPTSLFTS